MQNHAVFFDRDNTLNYDPGYLGDPEQVKLFPGVIEGIKKLRQQYNFKIIVISNQSGFTRNILRESDVIAVNERINELLREQDTEIDDFFYCPYHPDFDPPELTMCRKPLQHQGTGTCLQPLIGLYIKPDTLREPQILLLAAM